MSYGQPVSLQVIVRVPGPPAVTVTVFMSISDGASKIGFVRPVVTFAAKIPRGPTKVSRPSGVAGTHPAESAAPKFAHLTVVMPSVIISS
jgi:hypothetical protein